MKRCHVCGAECEKDAESCAVCGAELCTFAEYEAQLLKKQKIEKKKNAKPVFAVTVDNVVTAEIFKDVLKENEISFAVSDEEENMRVAFGGNLYSVDFYVEEENLDKAIALYDEIFDATSEFCDEDFEGFLEEENEEE